MNRTLGTLCACILGSVLSACSGAEDTGLITGAAMLPGDNCRSCHGAPASRYPDAPDWSVAGTVFESAESDRGAEGVHVEIVDASGYSEILTTNRVGNFYTDTPFEAPYWVSLEQNGVRVTMPAPAPSGGCNACHRIPSVGDAPGKLYLPPNGTFPSIAECDGKQTLTIGASNYDCAPYRCRSAEGTSGATCHHSCTGPDECAGEATCQDGQCIRP